MAHLAVDPQSLDAAASAVQSASLDGVDAAAAAALRSVAACVGGGECAAVATRLAGELGAALGGLGDQLTIFAAVGAASADAYRRVDQHVGDVFGGAR